MSEERLKLEDIITSGTGKALIDEIKYNELMQLRVEKLLKQNRELKNIIKEVREYIEDNTYKANETEYMDLTGIKELLEIYLI